MKLNQPKNEEAGFTAETLLELEKRETYFLDLLRAPNGYYNRMRAALDQKMGLLLLLTELVDSMTDDGPWGINALNNPHQRVRQQIIALVYKTVKANPYSRAIWDPELVKAFVGTSPILFVLTSDRHHIPADRWTHLYHQLMTEIYELNLQGTAYARYYFFLMDQVRRVDSGLPVDLGESIPELKDKLVHKAQILLLDDLGFFQLEKVASLSQAQKAVVVSALLNRDEKNTHDYLTYGGYKGAETKLDYKRTRYREQVNALYLQAGLTPQKQ